MLEVFAVSLLYRTRASLTWSHKPCSQLLSCAGAAGAKLHAEIYKLNCRNFLLMTVLVRQTMVHN